MLVKFVEVAKILMTMIVMTTIDISCRDDDENDDPHSGVVTLGRRIVMTMMVDAMISLVGMVTNNQAIVIRNADGWGGNFDVGNGNDKSGNCTCRMIVGVGCS